MNFPAAVMACLTKYATFSGRASRSEYWYFQLFVHLVLLGIVVIAASVEDTAHVIGAGSSLFYLAIILPSLAAAVRRLHDRNRSGWHYLWVLAPFFGAIVVLIWLCQKGVDGENRFGPDPLLQR